jgi:proprotein convertase subtilisin/kexin type 5
MKDKKCVCPPKHYDAGKECKPCHYRCGKCYDGPKDCPNECAEDRINPPTCHCPKGFYDDGTSPKCKECDCTCATCNKSGSCLKCSGIRVLPNCTCPEGMFQSGTLAIGHEKCKHHSGKNDGTCEKCNYKCHTCKDEKSCEKCYLKSHRSETPKCLCDAKYYDASTSSEKVSICKKCKHECATCKNGDECTTCIEGRDKPPKCECPKG